MVEHRVGQTMLRLVKCRLADLSGPAKSGTEGGGESAVNALRVHCSGQLVATLMHVLVPDDNVQTGLLSIGFSAGRSGIADA